LFKTDNLLQKALMKSIHKTAIVTSVALTAFFCSVVGEHGNPKASVVLLPPLLLIGISSVLYWSWSEARGHGDLRLYALVQYLPAILIPLIIFLYKSPASYLHYLILLFVFYSLAKRCYFRVDTN